MGACICRNILENDDNLSNSQLSQLTLEGERTSEAVSICHSHNLIAKLVLETLSVIGSNVVNNDPEPPNSVLLLHVISEDPSGWLGLIYSLMDVIPIEHPMGASVIGLLLDESPLPARKCILTVANIASDMDKYDISNERNFCIIIGCLAEKLAGPNSISLLNDDTLKYLLQNVTTLTNDPSITLLSIIALEKFAQTKENKRKITKSLEAISPNPLIALEQYVNDSDYILRQIGFCARWCLDNYFIVPHRTYSYETEDLSHINAMLNKDNISEYLKISPDCLEARCDAYIFDSVRCTFEVKGGCWYYEVLIITPGVMQIGWATKNSTFMTEDGFGVGDDRNSIGFDGCRQLIWHNTKSQLNNLPAWKSGSILGCFLDFEANELIFSLDGVEGEPLRGILNIAEDTYCAAASFLSFQQCRFNFGAETFHYPPKRCFQNFNQFGQIDSDDKIILPRHLYLEMLKHTNFKDDCCILCFDKKAVIKLKPCQHVGLCKRCVQQLDFCPFCRCKIEEKVDLLDAKSKDNSIQEIDKTHNK